VTVSNNELSITTGAVTAGLFSGTLWSIRTFNGCIHYTPASGLYPNFSATPTAGSSPLAVQFTDTTYTSDPGGVTSWAWDFDNDGIVDSNAQNPPHTYPNGGTYSVSLMVTDNTHGMQSITKTDYIVVDPISVDFTATPTTGAAPLAVQFTDTSTGNPVAWQWDFDNDGTIDSTAQNPAHTYVNPGLYTVSMTATNGGNQGTETKVDVINVIGSTNNTRSPEILEFQFNEARGATVNNTASTNLAPPTAVVAQTNGTPVAQAWQADPGRIGFGGNEPGFGCLGADSSSPYEHRVDTGWPIDITGSHTIMFWANNTGSSGSSYAFGSGSGSSGRCWYTTSGYMSLRSWGTLGTSYVDTATDPAALTGWNHWAVVIDDAAGTAQWYLNGAADGTGQTFTPNSFTYQGGNFTIGSYGTTTASFFTRYWEMDDFRLYARALTPAELMTAMAAENPTTAIFGDGCIGPSVVPSLSASGGAPAVGNAAFTIDVAGLEAGVPQALNLGVLTVSGGLLPYDLGVLLANFTGCFAETLPDISVSLAGGSTANVSVPIPNIPAIAGSHAYVQTVVLGSTGAVSPVLDINLQM
jgi:PKD repeat protein